MKALITGASSGIGRCFAHMLDDMGYDLILVARRKNRLEKLKNSLNNNITIYILDLSTTFNCMELYNKVKNEDIDVIINAAGFGLLGEFSESKLDRELDMIDLNIKAVHALTKFFLRDFIKKDKGYILNVASIASFEPGPLMSTYYATKAYVYSLTTAINYELKKKKSNVYVGCLNPGPVDTEFNKVANVKFNLKSHTPEFVCSYALKKMFKKKRLIMPGISIKLGYIASKLLPVSVILKFVYNAQEEKM